MVTIEQDCDTCYGSGIIVTARCTICQTEIATDDAWWLTENTHLPCGHEVTALEEQFGCPTCLGTGWITTEITQQAYRAQRLRRISRGLIFILLAAIPTAIFLSIVWQQEDMACASWLYTLIPLFFLK